MSLAEYRRKRSFGQTREPEPGKPAPKGRRPIFVVQLHHASRRHYDFRLQVGDALKSWAIPKGPSYDPKVKRMAVEVEDHPLDYASFEGEIPQGHYGGGHVAQFDHGVWSSEGDVEAQLAKGHLRFELFGERLKGGWHLVRSGKPARQPQWLLFKEDDAYAGKLEADDLLEGVTAPPAADAARAGRGKAHRKHERAVAPARPRQRRDWKALAAKLPGARRAKAPTEAFEPQLARLGEAPPQGEQWLHEIKWDGYRILATMARGRASLWSRNALAWTQKLPDIAAAIEALGLSSVALDGELIAGQGRKEDFNLLQATLSGEQPGRLVLTLFDLLHVDGIDISAAPLLERKALLQQLLDNQRSAHLAYSSHVEGEGTAAFTLAGEQHFEGIISKRADRPYHPGRSDEWRKTKQLASDEFAVVGYTAPKGSRSGFGSLLLARPDPEHGWRYVGRVGTGFTETMLAEIAGRIGKAGGAKPTAYVGTTDTDLRHAKWFAPRFVVEVFYRGIGGQGLLRQPSLKAVREDKRVADLADSDRASSPPEKVAKAARMTKNTKTTKTTKTTRTTRTGRGRNADVAEDALPTLSSPGKILFPEDRISKQQVWDYYRAVMPWLLPEIVDRPLSIIRCPAGTGQQCFFQKHHTAGLERVASVRLKEEGGVAAEYLVARDAPAVLELVQFNAIEFHPWGAHADTPERADRVVFDLDPGPEVAFAEVKRAATDIRKHLARLELESFLRVSGGKGLHVVVPLNPGCDWDLVKRFARGFAEALAGSEPERFLATATKRLRNRRIFVDYLRNGRGATAVASYSLRARPGAPVALPLAWSALGRLERADAFRMDDVLALLRRRRKDPWEGIDRLRQDLSRWAAET